jgi:hypothetical protein
MKQEGVRQMGIYAFGGAWRLGRNVASRFAEGFFEAWNGVKFMCSYLSSSSFMKCYLSAFGGEMDSNS